MAYGKPHHFRPRFVLWNPLTWWDRFFIRAGSLFERLWSNSIARGFLRLLVAAFRLLIWGVAPTSDVRFDRPPSWPRVIAVALAAALAAYLFSYWLNYVFAWIAGTLAGSDPMRRYFLDDADNIRIYQYIAPIYVACATAVMYIYATNASFTDSDANRGQGLRWRGARAIWFIALVIGLCGLAQYFYYDQVVARYSAEAPKRCKDVTYWFVERVQTELSLNTAGVAYFFGNLVRLCIVFAAGLCFIVASASVIRLGLRIEPAGAETYDIGRMRQDIYSFSMMELWTKGLYLILNIHGRVWGASCLAGDLNIKTAGVLVFLVGYVILTIPRNFVEYRLWRYLRERARIEPHEGLPDLRSERINLLYSLMATAFFLAVAIFFTVVGFGYPDVGSLLLGVFGFLRSA